MRLGSQVRWARLQDETLLFMLWSRLSLTWWSVQAFSHQHGVHSTTPSSVPAKINIRIIFTVAKAKQRHALV